MVAVNAPKPHDPRLRPEHVSEQFEQTLADSPDTLADELEQYEAAYAVLADALQDRG